MGSSKTLAQTSSTGALSGTITDPAGASVSDVQVTVTNEATGQVRKVTSRSDGSYVVPILPPGSYRVEVSESGFKSSVRAEVLISITETVSSVTDRMLYSFSTY